MFFFSLFSNIGVYMYKANKGCCCCCCLRGEVDHWSRANETKRVKNDIFFCRLVEALARKILPATHTGALSASLLAEVSLDEAI